MNREAIAQETHHCDLHLYKQSECYKIQTYTTTLSVDVISH